MRQARPHNPTRGLFTWPVWSLLLGLLCLPLGACKQGQGERCQVDRDCEEGTICCVREDDRALGGTCQPESACELTPVSDGGSDTGEFDLGADTTPPADKGGDEDQAVDGDAPDAEAPADEGVDQALDGEMQDDMTMDEDGPAMDGTTPDAAPDA